ncbi:hypothetical protein [Aeoliella sp. SH292]|uniref:hypothetical protein n=1 Tax=Aeoliella sp. SH292 TaxID=3454464 RepID=UPI003F99F429
MSEILTDLLKPFVELLFYAVFYVLTYSVGWFVITVLTAGTLPMASMLDESRGERWYSMTFERHGRRYALPSTVVLVGLLTIVFLAIEAYMLYHGA